MSWLKEQSNKVSSFFELLITLVLDALLILSVWGLREFLLYITSTDLSNITDNTVLWTVRLSEISTIAIITVYILLDFFREVMKTWKEILSIVGVKPSANSKESVKE